MGMSVKKKEFPYPKMIKHSSFSNDYLVKHFLQYGQVRIHVLHFADLL